MKQILVILSFFLLTAQTCSNTNHAISKEVFRHWVHSFEEDKQNIEVYRPADYDFPLSRGREGFEVKENQEFVLHNIGPADGIEKVGGNWQVVDKNKIKVQLSNAAIPAYEIELVEVSPKLLKIKKIINK